MFTLLTGPGYDADGDLSWGAHWFDDSWDHCDYDWLMDEYCPADERRMYCIAVYFYTSPTHTEPET